MEEKLKCESRERGGKEETCFLCPVNQDGYILASQRETDAAEELQRERGREGEGRREKEGGRESPLTFRLRGQCKAAPH